MHCGDGPYWDKVRSFSNECRESWWTNLLYVNNLVRYDAHAGLFNKMVSYIFPYYVNGSLIYENNYTLVHERDLVSGLRHAILSDHTVIGLPDLALGNLRACTFGCTHVRFSYGQCKRFCIKRRADDSFS